MTRPPAAPTSAAPPAIIGTFALLIAMFALLVAGFAPFAGLELAVGFELVVRLTAFRPVALELDRADVELERFWDFCEPPPRLGVALGLV